VLKPEGLCFVLVPNMKSLAARSLGARYRYVYPSTLNYFTKATLTRTGGGSLLAVEVSSTHFTL